MLDTKNMLHSGLERFAEAVDMVMEADHLSAKDRVELICDWAYKYREPNMPDKLREEIIERQNH